LHQKLRKLKWIESFVVMKNTCRQKKDASNPKIRSISLIQMKRWIASDETDAERFWKASRPNKSSKAMR
jgi:hypothetical protein